MRRIGVDDVMRESLINHSLDVGDREMFMRLSGPDWRDHVVVSHVEESSEVDQSKSLELLEGLFGDLAEIRKRRLEDGIDRSNYIRSRVR